MILTNYYKFKRLPDTKSQTRIDCVLSTKDYPPFESLRNKKGELFVYYGDIPKRFNSSVKQRATKSITTVNGTSLSSIFMPFISKLVGYGDCRNTADGIVFFFSTDIKTADNKPPQQVELFISKGSKSFSDELSYKFIKGELNNEIRILRDKAVHIGNEL